MQLSPLPLLALLAVLGLAGCKAQDAPAVAPASAGAATPQNSPQELKGDIAVREMVMYPLDMNKVRGWAHATKEFGGKEFAAAAEKGQPADEKGLADITNHSAAEQIALANGSPLFREVLRKNGLTAHDYVMTGFSYMHAGMMASALTLNPDGKLPEEHSPANIKFVNANKAELEKLIKDAGLGQ